MKNERNNKVTVESIRNANIRLVLKEGSQRVVFSDNSINGSVSLRVRYSGKLYDLNLSRNKIKHAYKRSINEVTLK